MDAEIKQKSVKHTLFEKNLDSLFTDQIILLVIYTENKPYADYAKKVEEVKG